MSIALVMLSSHLILWRPLLLPSTFPRIRDFSNASVHIRWPKYWSFSFSINPSNEYSGLISLKIDWFALLAVQGTLRSPSPGPKFEGINFLALCILYGSAITNGCYQREHHSLDNADFCKQSNVSTFQHAVYVCLTFSAKKQLSSDFMAAVTICSDYGAQEEEICHYFHLFSFY